MSGSERQTRSPPLDHWKVEYMNPSIRTQVSLLILVSIVGIFAKVSAGQTLLLPGPAKHAVGEGPCEGVDVAIASENWRVRKGDTFGVRAVQVWNTDPQLKFVWM